MDELFASDETLVLSALIYNPAWSRVHAHQCSPAIFSGLWNRTLALAAERHIEAHGEIAPAIVVREFALSMGLEATADMVMRYIGDLEAFTAFDAKNSDHALVRLRQRWAMITLQDGLRRTVDMADEGERTVSEVIDALRTISDDAVALSTPENNTLDVVDPCEVTYNLAPTGCRFFDSAMPMGAIAYGQKIAISGVPGSGKTALAQQLTLGYLEQHTDARAVWGLGEMSKHEMSVRGLQALSGLTLESLQTAWADLDGTQHRKKLLGLERMRGVAGRFDIIPSPITPSRIEEVMVRGGARWVVLDYLQLCRPDVAGATRRDDVDACIRGFVDISQRHDAVMIILSNMGKAEGARKDRDVYTAFKESSEIAHAMDMCYTATKANEEDEIGAGITDRFEVIWRCLKARQGGRDINTMFMADRLSFEEAGAA